MGTMIADKLRDTDSIAFSVPTWTSEREVRVELPGVKVGILEADVRQQNSFAPQLEKEIGRTCDRLRTQYSRDNLREWEPVRTIRQTFRKWGVDPSKYRPSSEALLRRIVNGEDLPRVSTIVDIGNLGAIEMGWPYGCYNRQKLSGGIQIRLGKPGEQYDGIGRQTMRLEGRPVFSDQLGPFGSPVSDSTRTMVTESTRELLAIVCAPENSSETALQEAISTLAERLVVWCGASSIKKRIINASCEYQIDEDEVFIEL